MADVTVPLGGWGYGNWDASEWGTNSPPLPLGTGQLGTATVAAGSIVSVTGLAGTSALGTAIGVIEATVNVSGVSATGIANYPVFDAIVFLDGWGSVGWGDQTWVDGSLSFEATTQL